MREYRVGVVAFLVSSLSFVLPGWCQTSANPLHVAQAQKRGAVPAGEVDARTRINNWTVTVLGGPLSGMAIQIATDLGTVLDDGDNLRVLPIVSRGAKQNVLDLLYLKGADIAFVYADAFEELKRESGIKNIEQRVQYISQAQVSGAYIIVRPEIKSLKDLEGKKFGAHVAGTGVSTTTPILFRRLGINIIPVNVPNPVAIEKMKTGEFAGVLHLLVKGGDDFAKKIPAEHGFHLLPVKYDSKFEDYYTPYTINGSDYPNIAKPGELIETIGVPAVIAVYNWPPETDRYRRVERFIQYYFERFDRLKHPPFQPEWKNVSLGAKVPGWIRFSAAEEALSKLARNELSLTSSTADNRSSGGDAPADSSDPQQRRLYDEFLAWKRQKTGR